MASNRIAHYITSGGGKVGFLTSDSYSVIGTIVGVNKVTATDQLAVMAEVDDLRQSGSIVHLRCRVAMPDGKVKTRKVICASSELATARATLIGKSYAGGTIRTAAIKRERVLY